MNAHNNFYNHSQQITLHSHIQYSRFIALTPVSNTVLQRFTSLTTCYAVLQLNSCYSPSSTLLTLLCTTCSKSPLQDSTVSLLLNAGLILPLMCFLNIQLCHSQSSGSVWHCVFFSWRYWHNINFDIRGFMCCHSTRRSCAVLHYSYPVIKLLIM